APSTLLTVVLSLYGCLFWTPGGQVHAERAICFFNTSGILGLVEFTTLNSSYVRVAFLASGVPEGKHGFHIHQYGDLTKGCTAAGGHFNPESVNHGGPDSPVRHVGDLGNVVAASNGVVAFSRDDSYLRLSGNLSILGRSVVLHAGEDDYGLGGYPDSLTTGHSGARIACCPIVYAP
ncbi:unnamed protein product, partial [Ixodes hexagonus]